MNLNRRRLIRWTTVGLAALSLGLALTACDGGSQNDDSLPPGGVVEGRVLLEGDVPDPKYINVVGCGYWTKTWTGDAKPIDEKYLVNKDGSVPNTFVWAIEGPHTKVTHHGESRPTQLVEIDHHYFAPHVVGVMRDQEVRFVNEDPGAFEIAVPIGDGQVRDIELRENRSHTFSFAKAIGRIEVVPKKHTWLRTWMFVLDHPFFASSDPMGRFRIEGLTPGKYRFGYWHETWGEGEFEVTVAEGERVKKTLKLSQKSD